MTKKEIVTRISEETGLKRRVIERVVDRLLFDIIEEVASGNEVRFRGFGTFRKTEVAARTGRNPRTGETIAIPERIVPEFKFAKGFKERVEWYLSSTNQTKFGRR